MAPVCTISETRSPCPRTVIAEFAAKLNRIALLTRQDPAGIESTAPPFGAAAVPTAAFAAAWKAAVSSVIPSHFAPLSRTLITSEKRAASVRATLAAFACTVAAETLPRMLVKLPAAGVV